MQCMIMYIYIYLIVPLKSSLYYLHVPCFQQKHMSTHLQPFFERGSVTQRARVRALQDMEEAMTRLCVHVAWGKGAKLHIRKGLPKDRCKLVVVGLCWLTSRL